MKLLKERVEAQNLNLTLDLFPNSQLGPDAERFASVQTGDIDIDLQGGSAMSTAFPKIGVLDAAYAFNDIDHFFKWVDSERAGLLQRLQRRRPTPPSSTPGTSGCGRSPRPRRSASRRTSPA